MVRSKGGKPQTNGGHDRRALSRNTLPRDNSLANKNDMTALFRIGYGLYVVTSNDGKKDNGLIVNTVTQLTDNPLPRGCQYQQSKLFPPRDPADRRILNVNCLSVDAPFSVFEQFGFQSGRTVDKFAGEKVNRSRTTAWYFWISISTHSCL